MAYDENIYAKIISGEITKTEIDQLKTTGEWDEIQSILEAVEDLTLQPHDKQDGYEKLLIKRNSNTTKKATVRWLLPLLTAAATILLIVGVFFTNTNNQNSISTNNGQILKFSEIEYVTISLNDGSTLEYSDAGNNKNQIVHLEGEAYFDVVPGNPLEVQTKNGTIEVLGTQFNVRAWGNQLTVDCYTGRVKVMSKQGQIELAKMESVSTTQGDIHKSTITYASPAWIYGTSRIKQEPLTDVFRELERQYNITVKSARMDRTFSGEFSHNNLREALDDVCLPMGLQYKIIQSDIVEIYE